MVPASLLDIIGWPVRSRLSTPNRRPDAHLVPNGPDTLCPLTPGARYPPTWSPGLAWVDLDNAREARAVPGRKTDANDAQWIQRLHACGLLRASFRPDREISALRSYLQLWERHLDYTAAHKKR